jgi:uncharacterized protein (TIGR02145 family)
MKNLIIVLCCLLSLSVAGQDDLNYDGNNDGCVNYEDVLNILTEYGQCEDTSIFECGDSLLHYNDYYATVEINGRCWFQENLRYLPTVMPVSNSSTDEVAYFVHGYNGNLIAEAMETAEYYTYGTLYNYPAVISTSIILCPTNWHVPTNDEWVELSESLGGNLVSGHKLKDNIEWNGSNESGFTALPGGFKTTNIFLGLGENTYFWHSTAEGWYGTSTILGSSAGSNLTTGFPSDGMYVRCIQD